MRNMHVKASAPAKVILFGEHAVVYGQPAIAVAINKRAFVEIRPASNQGDKTLNNNELLVDARDLNLKAKIDTKTGKVTVHDNDAQPNKILEATARLIEVIKDRYNAEWPLPLVMTITSEIPRGAGLGSSAAVSVATTAALTTAADVQLSKEEISSIAYEAEKVHHGTPSGIDNTIATFGGAVYFKRPEVKTFSIPSFTLIIGDTQKERETKAIVLGVRKRKEKIPHVYNPLLDVFGNLVNEAHQVLRTSPLDLETLGHLFNINQGLLSAIGVSSLELEQLIWAARQTGALGAKLTGAGAGGSMIALVSEENAATINDAIQQAGGLTLSVAIDTEGVLVEKL